MTFEDISVFSTDVPRRRVPPLGERAEQKVAAGVETFPRTEEATSFAVDAHTPPPANWPRVFPGL